MRSLAERLQERNQLRVIKLKQSGIDVPLRCVGVGEEGDQLVADGPRKEIPNLVTRRGDHLCQLR